MSPVGIELGPADKRTGRGKTGAERKKVYETEGSAEG